MRKIYCVMALIIGLTIGFWMNAFAQTAYPKLVFHRKPNSTFFLPHLTSAADSALLIAAVVLNSKEFRDTLATFSFPCRNYSFTQRCPPGCSDCSGRLIGTKTILDSLYRETNVGLTLQLDNQGGSSFGATGKNSYLISSHYPVVLDTRKMPFSYHYAIHLCHEYMHNVGFYHSRRLNRQVDIAEQTGEVAYVILLRWYRTGVHPF